MAWIESHDTLAEHPKTKRLARLLRVSRPAAIGHLHLLWWWAIKYAQDGDLTQFDAAEIADACMWDGDPDQFVEALVQARFVDRLPDGRLEIHDWWEYAGRLLQKREQARERARQWRNQRKSSSPAAATHERTHTDGELVQDTSSQRTDSVRNCELVAYAYATHSEQVAYAPTNQTNQTDQITPPPARENDQARASDHVPASPLPSREGDSRPAANEEAIRLSAEYLNDPKFRPSERNKRTLVRRSDWAITDFDEALQQGMPPELIRQAMQLAAPGSSPREIVAKARALWEKQQRKPPARASPPVKLRIYRPKDPDQEANAA